MGLMTIFAIGSLSNRNILLVATIFLNCSLFVLQNHLDKESGIFKIAVIEKKKHPRFK